MESLVRLKWNRIAKPHFAARWPMSPGSTKCAPAGAYFGCEQQVGAGNRHDGKVCGETGVTRRNEVRADHVSRSDKQHSTTPTNTPCRSLHKNQTSIRRAFSIPI